MTYKLLQITLIADIDAYGYGKHLSYSNDNVNCEQAFDTNTSYSGNTAKYFILHENCHVRE